MRLRHLLVTVHVNGKNRNARFWTHLCILHGGLLCIAVSPSICRSIAPRVMKIGQVHYLPALLKLEGQRKAVGLTSMSSCFSSVQVWCPIVICRAKWGTAKSFTFLYKLCISEHIVGWLITALYYNNLGYVLAQVVSVAFRKQNARRKLLTPESCLDKC